MQRRQLLGSFLALTAAERLGLLGAARAETPGSGRQGIRAIKGEVSLNGQAARAGMPVNPGDTIRTGAGSEAIYVIGQDAYLQRDHSVVTLVTDTLKSGLRMVNGKLLAVFGKGDKQLETATATIGIRGTACYIESAPAKVYFCLCYGAAEITPLADPTRRETVQTKHHDYPLYLYPDGSRMMVPAKVENHTDDELILLESLVGRTPPFYTSDYVGGSY